jgi:CHAT domain-containing protein/Tfp pilus assembly protein PilF
MFQSAFTSQYRLILALVSLLTLISWGRTAFAQSVPAEFLLQKPVVYKIQELKSLEFSLEMEAGDWGRVLIRESGADVIVTLLSPNREERVVTNSMAGYFGQEHLFIYASQPGTYTIRIWTPRRALEPGEFSIELLELRKASDRDFLRLRAQALCTDALNLNYKGTPENKQAALALLQEAAPLWRLTNEAFQEIDTYLKIGLIHMDLGDAQKAIPAFQQVRELSLEHELQVTEVQALRLLGESYEQVGDLRQAQQMLELSMKSPFAPGGFLIEIHALNSIGGIALSQGEINRAITDYLKILERSRQHRLPSFEGMALSKLGRIYASIGEYQEALDYLNMGLRLHRSPLDMAFTLNNIGKIYLAIGDTSRSQQFFLQALGIAQRSGNQILISNTLNNLGLSSMQAGQFHQALEYFQQALDISHNHGIKPEIIESLTNIGKAYGAQGKADLALSNFQASLALTREIGNRNNEMINLAEIGAIQVLSGKMGPALECLDPALKLSRDFYNPRYQADILYYLARISYEAGNLPQAQQQIKEAIEISEKLRTNFILREMRASFLGTVQNYYRLYIDILVKASRSADDQYSAEAFRVNEMARARSLLETIVESRVDLRAGVAKELIDLETELRQKVEGKSELLSRKGNDLQTIRKTRDEIAALESELEQVVLKIRKQSPSYAALTYPKPLSVADIQREVIQDNKTLMLEYSLGKESSYLWEISRNSFRLHRLPAGDKIEEVAKNYYQIVSNRPARQAVQRKAEMKLMVETGQKLSQMLLGPVVQRLKGQTLIVVADGALQYVPFSALPLPAASDEYRAAKPAASGLATNRGKSAYLPMMLNHQILGAQSATSLAILADQLKDRPVAPRTLAVMADPVFGKYDDRVLNQINATARTSPKGVRRFFGEQERSFGAGAIDLLAGSRRKSPHRLAAPPPATNPADPGNDTDDETKQSGTRALIPRLPYTREEANAILKLAPDDSLCALDFKASRSLAMDQSLAQYRYLHFALHGTFDNKRPENSGLLFSTVDEYGQPKNGLLTVKDVYNLKLPVELVVLSACQTGLGREIRGEGLVGLTRGFMHAGARRVVASLWNVNDAATSALMKEFYQRILLGNEPTPREALRRAQIAVWRETKWQAPYFWAAFVLQGER